MKLSIPHLFTSKLTQQADKKIDMTDKTFSDFIDAIEKKIRQYCTEREYK